MHYVGIDVHSRQSTIAVLSPGTSKPRVKTVQGGPDLPPFYVPVVMRVGCPAAYSTGVRFPSDECGRS
jgi:hypothetical protein